METIKLSEVLSRLNKTEGLATDGIIVSRNGETFRTQAMDLSQATTSQAGIMGVVDKIYLETLKPWLRGSLGSYDSSEAFNTYLNGLSYDSLKSGRYIVYLGGVPFFVTFSVLYAKEQISAIWVEGSLMVTDNVISSNTSKGVTIAYRYYKNGAWESWKTIYDDVKSDTTNALRKIDRINLSLGAYSDQPSIKLTPKESNVAINANGVKVSKSGWAIAMFDAALGNEYLFKPGTTDGNVCVFSEYIDKQETRGVDYSYTYDAEGRIATAKATYLGDTHTYTYTYTKQEQTGTSEGVGEICTITDANGNVVDYLPPTYQTKVGTYNPLTLLNANAELPTDGYCRFVSNFQARGSIKVVVSYKVGSADLTMKVVRDGMTASMCTQLSKVNQKVDETKAAIENLNAAIDNSKDYYVAENDEKTGSPKFLNGKGNKDFLAEWHPFLIDHTRNEGDGTKPIGQLMNNNFFRFTTGAFAPTVGITEEMRAACDVQLYTDKEHTTKLTLKNGVIVTDKAGAHPYDAAEVYNSLGLVDLYDANGNKVRQLLPWETTETKYSINIGRYDTLYPVDRQVGKSGATLSGVFLKQTRYDGIDSGRFPLIGTAIAPCPVTTVEGKTRNFFYAYAVGDTNTTNGAGEYAELCSMYVNDGRTYPRVSDVSQVTNITYARKNNADPTSPLPFAEGGYHALNTFILCMELYYGTKYLHDNNLFGSGISSNDVCNSESTYLANGGVRIKEQGTKDWAYYQFAAQTPFGCNTELKKANLSSFINNYRPKEQCMESQMAASWATEFGIAENTEFEAYGVKYKYKNIAGVKGLADGMMNCKVYRTKVGTCKGYKTAESQATYDIELSLRMSLIQGMNISGDVFAYWGGGCACVGTYKNALTGSSVDFYLESEQSKWVNDKDVTKSNLGTFACEKVYSKLGTFGSPILSDGYTKKRLGFMPYKIENGGGIGSWQCMYAWTHPYWTSTENTRVLIGLRFRGDARYSACSQRFLYAYYSASIASVRYAGSAQCVLKH